MATTRLMPLHIGKGRSVSTAIKNIIDYSENPEKTDGGRLITGYECDSRVADEEFTLSKRQYDYITGRNQGHRDVLAYHLRQSFVPGEISPEEANRVGYELAMQFTKGNNAFVVCTHIDKSHIHNHIIFNSTTLDCTHKFRNFWGSTKAVRRISDRICVEHGLSIIEKPKPSKKQEHYGWWLGDNKEPSQRDKIMAAFDTALEQKPADLDAFFDLVKEAGVEVAKRGRQYRFRVPGRDRFARWDSLKGEYTEQAIRERIEGVRVIASSGGDARAESTTKVNLLIDIQARLQSGKGPGFERWARLHNLKEMAQTLIYLQENGLTDYAELERRAADATATFHDLSAKIKTAENRMAEISELQKQISTYSRTLDVYRQYKASGYSKSFRAQHEADILLHQAAKKHFDASGLGKLPTIKMLKQEYAELLAEKKTLYKGYREARENMKQLSIAKANTDRILRTIPATPDKEVQR